MSAHSLTSAVGIGSRSDDLVLDDLRILRMSSSDTGSKEVYVLDHSTCMCMYWASQSVCVCTGPVSLYVYVLDHSTCMCMY